MFGSVLTILIALLLLSALIFIHELAHFLTGKAVGIHAEVFSIGFGRPLIKFTRGGTEYRLCIVPAGGYVKFPGEYSEDEERLEGAYHQAPVWKRLTIVAAGPLSNILLGAALFAALAAGGLPGESEPIIGEVTETEAGEGSYWDDPSYRSPAAMAGLRPGDRIQSINGRAIDSPNEATQEVMLRPDKPTAIKALRDGGELEINLTPRPVMRGKMEVGQIGVRWMHSLAAYKEGDKKAEPRVIASIGGVEGRLEEALRNSAGDETEVAFSDGETGRFTARLRVAVAQEPAKKYADEGVALGSYLIKIDGKEIRSAADARSAILSGADKESRRMTFETNGESHQVPAADLTLSISVTAAEVDAERNPDVNPVRIGDRLRFVNGVDVADYAGALASVERAAAFGNLSTLEFARESAVLGGGDIQIKTKAVVRDGRVQIQGLTLRSNLAENPSYLRLAGLTLWERFVLTDAETSEKYLVGAAPPKTERHGVIGSIGKGVSMAGDSVKEILSFLKRLVSGEVSTKYVSGPVGIVNVTQKMLGDGWTWATIYSVLRLMAWISINLAIVNLLPIPIADGGQILFFLYEGARGRPLSLKIQAAIQNVSIWALMALFAVITLKDILYW